MQQNRILLVEDDDDIRTLYGFFLASCGFKVKAVKNGCEALVELQDYSADVILTDIAMPVLNGIELIEIVKNRTELADIPIVAVTSYGNNLQQRAVAAGADKVAAKPTDSQTLCDLVTSVIPHP
jgi:CheY-like chemotaxis protein